MNYLWSEVEVDIRNGTGKAKYVTLTFKQEDVLLGRKRKPVTMQLTKRQALDIASWLLETADKIEF